MTSLFAFIGSMGWPEIMVIMVIGVLLFGRRLPEVGRYLGKGIVEFKKGIKGVEDDIEPSGPSNYPPPEPPKPPARVGPTTPKFEEPPPA